MTVYLVSDTHLDHSNIIKYCDRPFNDVSHMNRSLINNWNQKVSSNDKVFFVGDLAMSNPSKAVNFYKQLNGNIIMIRGNHDQKLDIDKAPFNIVESLFFKYKGYDFYISHYPKNYQEVTDRNDNREEPFYSNPPEDFEGWNIHGHVHNNDIKNFPFLNQNDKTVNVGVDVINYKPVDISRIIDIIKTKKSYNKIQNISD
jgi:calcineurin-like phosphoesterase family protein